MFDSEDGYLHLLFANEDYYFLNSLTRMDLGQKIYYVLKKDGYRGVFFVQDMYEKFQVRTEDAYSAELYNRGMQKFSFLGSGEIKRDGRYYCIVHKNGKEMADRIIRLLGETGERYAIVLPIQVFCSLFVDEEIWGRLAAVLEEQRQYSIFLVTASVRADDSMEFLLDRHGIFNTKICPEIQGLLARPRRFLLYEELRVVLNHRYHVWNQMREKDIRRMLLRGLLFEGWKGNMEFLEDYTAFLYAWYHSPDFARQYSGILWKNEWWSMKKLAEQLSGTKVWRELEQAIGSLRREFGNERPLKELIIETYSVETGERDPVLAIIPSVTRIDQIEFRSLFQEGAGGRAEELRDIFYGVRDALLKPWSDGQSNISSIEFCLEQMKLLSCWKESDLRSVERIVELMAYSVYSSECETEEEMFEKKIEYYEQIIKSSIKVVKKRRQAREEKEKLEREKCRYQELLDRIQAMEPNEVTYGQKKEVVEAKKSLENTESIIGMIENEIITSETAIRDLEMAVRLLKKEDTMGETVTLLDNALKDIRNQKEQQAKGGQAFRMAQDKFLIALQKSERVV